MATSKLQIEVGDLLDREFPEYRIRENFRPDWFISSEGNRMELDFYIEEIKTAFEVQGNQHFEYVPFFHKDKVDFERMRARDREKSELCSGYGIRLYEICTKTDAIVAVKELQEKYFDVPKYKYSYTGSKDDRIKGKKEIISWYTRKIHEQGFRNGKERDAAMKNSEAGRNKRLETCKRNIEKFEAGEIEADAEKVTAWRRVIHLNGYEPDVGIK